jgi:transposase-like protein
MAITNDNLDELIGNAKTQDDLFGKDGVLKDLSKQLVERMLQAEITHHLGYEKNAIEGHHTGNSRNGKTKKTVKTGSGEIEIEVPRDRKSEFQPILIEKRQTRLKELDAQVLSLYGRGMTVRDIQEHVSELYGTDISTDLISNITDAVLSEVTEWRNRPLDKVYPIVFIDGFVVKARLNSVVCNRTVYVIYGITLEGQKERTRRHFHSLC